MNYQVTKIDPISVESLLTGERYVKELGMTLNTEVETELSIEEYTKVASKAPKGLKRPLSKLVSVVQL